MNEAHLRFERCARRACSGRAGRSSRMLSGGRDSVCLLDVAVALRAPARCARCTSTTACATQADADERHCAALCERLGRRARASRAPRGAARDAGARQPPGVGARPALRRGGASSRRARRAESPPGTPPATRSRRSSTGWRPRPAGARCWGCAPRDGPLVRPLLAFTREQTAAYCRARGLAWREDASNDDERVRARRVRHGLRAGAARGPPGGRGERAAHRRAAARGGRGARRARRRPSSTGATEIALARLARACRPRWRGSSCSGWPRTPPARTCARRGEACRRGRRAARARRARSTSAAASRGRRGRARCVERDALRCGRPAARGRSVPT